VLRFTDLEKKNVLRPTISLLVTIFIATLYYYSEISGCTLMLLILACDMWCYVNFLRRLALLKKRLDVNSRLHVVEIARIA